MKNLKTTIKLSVLALACLGAGALALQPTATAQAETEYADCIHMVNGASVCVKDGFSGIRWETKIDASKYTEGATFGTLVMPTGTFGDELNEEDIREDGTGALDLPANVDYENLPNKFYTVINYNEVAEGKEAAAYALELTARSYVKIDNAYYFVDLGTTDTSRSARQVALSADLDGELTGNKAKAVEYFGYTEGEHYEVTEENTGAAGTAFINLNNGATPKQTVVVNDFAIEGTIQEVIVGAEKIDDCIYADGTLTLNIKAGQNFPTGEKYVAVFTDEGIYTKPIIGATMVFDEFADFDVFAKIRGNMSQSTDKDGNPIDQWKISSSMQGNNKASDYEFGGYYVLGKTLDFSAEDVRVDEGLEHTVEGWRGASDFAKTKLGLTGTFNGLGRTIKGFQDGRQYTGLFQLVNGGTIKNTYFYNYTPTNSRAQVLAHYLIDPKIENVFIYSKEKMDPTKTQYILGAYLYQSKEDAANLSNVLVRIIYANVDGSNKARTGGLFGEFSGKTQTDYNWNNVYVATNIGISSRSGTKSYVMIGTSQKYIHIPKFVAVAENQKTENGYVLTEWRYKGSVGITLTDDGNMTATFTYKNVAYDIYSTDGDQSTTTFDGDTIKNDGQNIVCLNGVYCYYDIDALNAAKAEHNGYAAFLGETGGNCWEINAAGNLAFNSRK